MSLQYSVILTEVFFNNVSYNKHLKKIRSSSVVLDSFQTRCVFYLIDCFSFDDHLKMKYNLLWTLDNAI